MDLNWFFSTFSQSAAALLGVIAAFIIARLLALDERVATLKYDFDGFVVEKNKIEAKLKSLEISQIIKSLIINNPDFFTKNEAGLFKTLVNKDQLAIINNVIAPLTDEADVLLKDFETVKTRTGSYKEYSSRLYDNSRNNKSNVLAIMEDIDILKLQFKRIFVSYETSLQHLQNIQLIVCVLIVSFPILVVYPLHFLPLVSINISFRPTIVFQSLYSLKGGLLILFTIAFEFMFIYFLRLLKRTIANNQWGVESERDKYMLYKSYSKYLLN